MTTTASPLQTPYPVSDEQVTHYQRVGWVHVPELLPADLTQEMLARIGEGFRVKPSRNENWIEDEKFTDILSIYNGMAWKDDLFHSIATSPRMTSLAQALLGGEPGQFVHDMAFVKPAEHGAESSMHQDFPFSPFDRPGTMTVWVALTDMTPDMGTLEFLSGSHTVGPLGRYNRKAGDDMRAANPWLADRFPLEGGLHLRAGDATVHHDLTVHGSQPNSTPRTRSAYTARYMPADVLYTGTPHHHYDTFDLTPNESFASYEVFTGFGSR
ncbi:phytanoyl-CoA dioxygenase family protein [Pseudonocardia sp. NPDC049154]|uniref:phytanoyl-CoA dioxygenase family protein n=1 Tax=Pseudonocardia sp. NPDC049154 TaxID=3155501 RepID=UPI0033CBD2F4